MKARLITASFIIVTIVVAGAIIWQACHFVDSLQNNVQATKKMHLNNDNKLPERGHFDAASKQFSQQIESMTSDRPFGEVTKGHRMQGSEQLYARALASSEKSKFDEGITEATSVLKLITIESKSQRVWQADGKNRDEKMYRAMAYQLRAFCYLQKRKYREAIRDLDRAIALRPAYGGNYTNRGKAKILLGQKASGEADLIRARELPAAAEDSIADEHALDELKEHE